jgi:hypothetical protein
MTNYKILHHPQYFSFAVYKRSGWRFSVEYLKSFYYPSTGAEKQDILAAYQQAGDYVKLLKEIDDCIN